MLCTSTRLGQQAWLFQSLVQRYIGYNVRKNWIIYKEFKNIYIPDLPGICMFFDYQSLVYTKSHAAWKSSYSCKRQLRVEETKEMSIKFETRTSWLVLLTLFSIGRVHTSTARLGRVGGWWKVKTKHSFASACNPLYTQELYAWKLGMDYKYVD